MTEPWNPQPGKPAMTSDGKTLVTDLVRHKQWGLWSEWLIRAWNAEGHALGGEPFRDLIEPTAAILAAHGIDADGKPVVKAAQPEADAMGTRRPDWCDEATWEVARDAATSAFIAAEIDEAIRGVAWAMVHSPLTTKIPSSPAPSTRVDDRWFEAACAALTGVISAGGENYPNCAFDAARYADALMAEVAKREGR